jgi:hypothetical protein
MANVLPVLTIEAAGNQVNVTLTGAAFALVLAEYLDEHPEALLRGKPQDPK